MKKITAIILMTTILTLSLFGCQSMNIANDGKNSPKPTLQAQSRKTILATPDFIVAVKSDGTVLYAGEPIKNRGYIREWTDIVSICGSYYGGIIEDRRYFLFALKRDGTVVTTNDSFADSISGWKDIVDISCYGNTILGLKSDGTVVGESINVIGKKDTSFETWSEIIAVSTGGDHFVGLKKDGTVVACGDDDSGQCYYTKNWTDIVSISANGYETLGLKKDGTVLTTNIDSKDDDTRGLDNTGKRMQIGNLRDVVRIEYSDGGPIVAIKKNGTLEVVLEYADDKSNTMYKEASKWMNIADVSAQSSEFIVGLKSDGTLVIPKTYLKSSYAGGGIFLPAYDKDVAYREEALTWSGIKLPVNPQNNGQQQS